MACGHRLEESFAVQVTLAAEGGGCVDATDVVKSGLLLAMAEQKAQQWFGWRETNRRCSVLGTRP
jgi:hypothetical protein